MTGSVDRHLMLWDLRSGKLIKALLQHDQQITSISVDWPTMQAVTSSADRNLILWDVAENEVLSTLTGHPGSVWCCEVDWIGRRMVSGAGPGDNGGPSRPLANSYCEMEIEGHE